MLPSAVEIRDGGTYRRGFEEIKKHLYIPIGFLFDVKDFPSVELFNEYCLNREYEETKLKEMIKNTYTFS